MKSCFMSKVLSKTEFVDLVALKAGISKKDTKSVIDSFAEIVKSSVGSDNEIRLIGFGTFKKVHRNERQGRNPQTGDVVTISASDKLGFKSSVKY